MSCRKVVETKRANAAASWLLAGRFFSFMSGEIATTLEPFVKARGIGHTPGKELSVTALVSWGSNSATTVAKHALNITLNIEARCPNPNFSQRCPWT